jgi:hypothetical protein
MFCQVFGNGATKSFRGAGDQSHLGDAVLHRITLRRQGWCAAYMALT